MGSSKDHFLDFRVLLPGSQQYFREYLCENENIFENILGYCSRAQVLSIHAKNQSSKISCYSPFYAISTSSILRPILYTNYYSMLNVAVYPASGCSFRSAIRSSPSRSCTCREPRMRRGVRTPPDRNTRVWYSRDRSNQLQP